MLEAFNFLVILEYLPVFLKGLAATGWISLCGILGALLIGLTACTMRLTGLKLFTLPAMVYIEVVRSTPLLAQLYFFYFGLPSLGIRLSEVQVGIFALALNSGAYMSEIIRAGISAVPPGQVEAASATGLHIRQRLIYIVLPQAFSYSLPPLLGQAIVLVKDSALLSLISVFELTRAGQRMASDRFMPAEGFFTVAVGYLLLYYVLKTVSHYSNRALNKHRRREG